MKIKKLFKRKSNLMRTSDRLGSKLADMVKRDHEGRCVILITRENGIAHTTITGSKVILTETLTGVFGDNEWLVEIFGEAINNLYSDLIEN